MLENWPTVALQTKCGWQSDLYGSLRPQFTISGAMTKMFWLNILTKGNILLKWGCKKMKDRDSSYSSRAFFEGRADANIFSTESEI